ncbi:MAG: hypothetical protein ACRDY7_00985 [Acidimicrobiia bacterium]
MAEAWPCTDVGLRLALTRHWAWLRRFELGDGGHDVLAVAAGLSTQGEAHPLWGLFAWTHWCASILAGTQPDSWVPVSSPEPSGPGAETVRLRHRHSPDGAILKLVLRHTPEGALVAGHGVRCVRRWPPSD